MILQDRFERIKGKLDEIVNRAKQKQLIERGSMSLVDHTVLKASARDAEIRAMEAFYEVTPDPESIARAERTAYVCEERLAETAEASLARLSAESAFEDALLSGRAS